MSKACMKNFIKPTHVKHPNKQTFKQKICIYIYSSSANCLPNVFYLVSFSQTTLKWQLELLSHMAVFIYRIKNKSKSIKFHWWYRDGLLWECQSDLHPGSFMAGIWCAMGKKEHWRWMCRISPLTSPSLVSCWDLNKPKDYLRAFKCKFWWMCKAPPVNLSLIICLPD